MKKLSINTILAVIIMLLSSLAFGIDAVKFRYAVSVYTDEMGGGIQQPEGIACNDDSLFIVADTGNNRLLQYSLQEKDLKGGTEIKIPELTYPLKVQINSKGEIYALDGKKRRIVRMNPKGDFMGYLDPKGFPYNVPFFPRSFIIDKNDDIFVLDVLSGSVLLLDPTGSYKRHIDLPKNYGFISDLAVDTAGNLLIIDSVNSTIFIANSESETFSPLSKNLKETASFPTGIAVDGRGLIYLVDTNGNKIVILTQDGSLLGQQLGLGWVDGALHYPTQLCLNNKGEVFITDRGNSRVQIFTTAK